MLSQIMSYYLTLSMIEDETVSENEGDIEHVATERMIILQAQLHTCEI